VEGSARGVVLRISFHHARSLRWVRVVGRTVQLIDLAGVVGAQCDGDGDGEVGLLGRCGFGRGVR